MIVHGEQSQDGEKQQIQALTQLGWTDRAISRETGIYRGSVSKYRKKFQNQPEVPIDLPPYDSENRPKVPTELPLLPRTNSTQILPYIERIRTWVRQQLTAQRIYQDLIEEHGYTGSYDAVKRYARKLSSRAHRSALSTFRGVRHRLTSVKQPAAFCLTINGNEYGFLK